MMDDSSGVWNEGSRDLLMQEQTHYSQFKKTLATHDQRALEQLFIYASLHVAEAG